MNVSTNQRINWSAAAVLFGLLGNMCVGAWYASSLSSRVGELEEKMTVITGNQELLVRMDERLKMITDGMKELKVQVAKASEERK